MSDYAVSSEIRRLRLTDARQIAKLCQKTGLRLSPAFCRRIADAAVELQREARTTTDANSEVAAVFDAIERCSSALDGMMQR
jgi:hypothetical protein